MTVDLTVFQDAGVYTREWTFIYFIRIYQIRASNLSWAKD